MKTYALPVFCLLASTLLLTPARSADRDSRSGVDRANDCSTHAAEFSKSGVRNTENSQLFLKPYYLKFKDRRPIPVYRFKLAGPNDVTLSNDVTLNNDVTLIVLIHRKQGASDEIPDIDAICTDQNHAFQSQKPWDTISFESGDQEHLYLRFRLDLQSLPNTYWKKIPGDSVQMKEVKYPYPNPLPSPGPADWCDPPSSKHVREEAGAHPTDMFFMMCPHNGREHRYKYSLHMDVSGKDFPIDPLIIHQPY